MVYFKAKASLFFEWFILNQSYSVFKLSKSSIFAFNITIAGTGYSSPRLKFNTTAFFFGLGTSGLV
jgi:multisubunit Na+/H+ antiporter MnhE subunit